jgi:uncharacterized protein (TIGR03437 family)
MKLFSAAGACLAALLLQTPFAGAAERRTLRSHVPRPVATGRAARTGRLAAGTRLDLNLGLPLRNSGVLNDLLGRLSNPASTDYRHYLSPQQFTEQFGPSEDDYRKVSEFARAAGLTITSTTPNRMLLNVSGTAGDLERAFQITMRVYQDPDAPRTFHAPDAEPSVPTGVPILEVIGLDDYAPPRPMNLKVKPLDEVTPMATGSGPSGLFMGSDFRAAYAPGVIPDGAGQSIGLLEFGPYFPNDVTVYKRAAGLPDVTVTNVLLDNVTGLAPPGNDDGEEALDIQVAMSMAPGISQIIVYQGGSAASIFNRMATDNLARQLSCSWGFIPPPATMDQIFREFAAQGQTMFVSSGDAGAYTAADRIFAPADDPNITSVGGTSLTTKGAGGPWLGETAWKGSGGGISNTYSLPDWQQDIGMTGNGGSRISRNFPDVSMLADTIIYLVYKNGVSGAVGGTSASAPMWAGFMALVNQQAEMNGVPPVGFLNPALTQIGNGARYTADLHDITVGGNTNSKSPSLFQAVAGYDLATGWGSPNGQALIDDLAAGAASGKPSFNLAVAPYGISLIQGNSGDVAVNVSAFGGFGGDVKLTVSGLPSGVAASFSPSTITKSGTLSISVGGTVAKGGYPLIVQGTSGNLSQTVGINLTVIAPDFSLTALPGVVSVAPSGSSQSTIAQTTVGGFNGAVSLAASNLPAGLQASVNAGTASDSYLVSFTASAQTAPGAYSITITGTSGSLRHSVILGVLVAQSAGAPAPVDLSAWYNYVGISSDGSDAPNSAYSAKLLGGTQIVDGVPYFFGAPDAWNDLSTVGVTIPLPSGKFGTLRLLGTGENGAQQSQKFTVKYTDGTSDAFTQSFSDWFTPQNFPGETRALTFPYRNTGAGSRDNRPFNLYQYTFTLKASKNVASVVVPGASGVHVLAMTLVPPGFTGVVDYALAASAASMVVPQGRSAASVISIVPSGGFSGSVAFKASGLPTGVTAAFGAGLDAQSATLTLTAAGNAPPGTAAVTITGDSGGLVHSIAMTVTVTAVSPNTVAVDMGPSFNLTASYTDGSTFAAGGGIDGVGTAYSATLLGASQVWNGSTFRLGSPNASNAATGQTLTLPGGQFARLDMLATGVQGNQAAQKFIVTYSDGSTAVFTQSLSDWFTPQNYTGESAALTMPYRVTSSGGVDARVFDLYGYSFTLAPSKTVNSVTLPANANVVVLALTLVPAAPASKVSITGVVNGATFQPGVSPGGWITIFGSNLAASSRQWGDADFVNSTLPSQLDGVSVTVGGYQAAVYFVSPGQLNVQVPTETPLGSTIPMQVTSPQGTAVASVAVTAAAPGFFSPDGKYAAALHADYSPVNVKSPAKAGETVLLFGTGFGATTPPVPGRQIVTDPAPAITLPSVKIGGLASTVSFGGIVAAGLYQFNVTLPVGVPDGDVAVTASVGSAGTQAGLYLPVGR